VARAGRPRVLLFFEISADFDVTWGESAETTLPPIAVVPLLVAEFNKRESWMAESRRATGCSCRCARAGGAPDLVMHPLGTLRISQRLAAPPRLDKIGTQRPSDANKSSCWSQGVHWREAGRA